MDEPHVAEAIDLVKSECLSLRVLGSYPKMQPTP